MQDYEPSKIDEVILVGGSTRIPKVQEIVGALSGKLLQGVIAACLVIGSAACRS